MEWSLGKTKAFWEKLGFSEFPVLQGEFGLMWWKGHTGYQRLL